MFSVPTSIENISLTNMRLGDVWILHKICGHQTRFDYF